MTYLPLGHGEAWNILGHPLHAMTNGFPLAFAALGALMILLLPRIGPVVRWGVRWTFLAAVVAYATGVNAAGGVAEALEEIGEEVSLGRHAILASLFLVTLLVAMAIGRRQRDNHELSGGERWAVLLAFLIVGAAAWFGGEHELAEEREEEMELATPQPEVATVNPPGGAVALEEEPGEEEGGSHEHAPGTPEHNE